MQHMDPLLALQHAVMYYLSGLYYTRGYGFRDLVRSGNSLGPRVLRETFKDFRAWTQADID